MGRFSLHEVWPAPQGLTNNSINKTEIVCRPRS